MKHKIIKLSLVVAILNQSLLYASMDDLMSSSFMNVTPGGTYKGNGKTTFTTTSVYFRFGPSMTSIEPIIQTSPPSLGASCSGFNLKGMFVQILGLDRIAKMLKSAGASFAWGIMVGLVYSLPGVASVFNMINAWANKIMEMLQNACHAGQAIGQAMASSAFSSGIGKTVSDGFKKFDSMVASMSPDSRMDITENGGHPTVLEHAVNSIKKSNLASAVDGFFSDAPAPSKEAVADVEGTNFSAEVQSSATGYFMNFYSGLFETIRSDPSNSLNVVKLFAPSFNTYISSPIGVSTDITSITFDNDTNGDNNSVSIDSILNESSLNDEQKLNLTFKFLEASIVDNDYYQITEDSINKRTEIINDRNHCLGNDTNTSKCTNEDVLDADPKAIHVSRSNNAIEAEDLGILIGKAFAYKYLMGSVEKTTLDTFKKDFTDKFNSIRPRNVITLLTIANKNSPNGSCNITFGSGTSSVPYTLFKDGGSVFLSSITSDGKTLQDRYGDYIDGIISGKSSAASAISSGVIPVIDLPSKKLVIYSQTPIEERDSLKTALVDYSVCQMVEGFEKALPVSSIGHGINSKYYTDGSELIVSKDSVKSVSEATTPNPDISKYNSGVKKGLEDAASDLINKCNSISLTGLDATFKEQDQKNKNAAAAAMPNRSAISK